MAVPDIAGAMVLFQYLTIFLYVLLVLGLGSIALKGYRGYLTWWLRWPLRIGLGFLVFLCGIGFSSLIQLPIPFSSIIMISVGGILTGIILAIALNITSYRMPGLMDSFEGRVKHYKKKINALQSGGPLKTITPARIIGMVLFLVFIIFALLNFRGFPSIDNEINSLMTSFGAPSIDLSSMMPMFTLTLIFLYFGLSMLFGSIVLIGYRGVMRWWLKWLFRLAIGFICVVCGLGIGTLLPIVMPFGIFIQMIIGSIICGIVLSVATNIISYRAPGLVGGFEKRIEHYENKIKKLKSGGPIKAIIPARIIGIALFVGFVIFLLLNFRGFPSIDNEIMSLLGGGGDNFSDTPGCQAMMNELYANLNLFMSDTMPDVYNNPTLQAEFEQGCEENIIGMYKFDLDIPIVIGVTGDQNKMCLGTETEYCMKIDLSGFGI